jgi:Ca2+-binding RTX toxin-like protein
MLADVQIMGGGGNDEVMGGAGNDVLGGDAMDDAVLAALLARISAFETDGFDLV